MNGTDTDIGRQLQAGERVPLSGTRSIILIDSKRDHELLLIARSANGNELVHAGSDSPYSTERYENGQRIEIRISLLHPEVRYTLGAYASRDEMPDILATLHDPRCHLPIRSRGEGAVAIAEFYHKDGWRMKADGGWYRGGLQSMLSV